MQFVKDGPDIPIQVMQALEEGRLVFFCGAGVSKGEKLPLFSELVDQVYEALNEEKKELEFSEYHACNYDRVLGLLEKRMQPGLVRKTIIDKLTLPTAAKLKTHKALLTLCTTVEKSYHLVTTNFDRGFLEAGLPSNQLDVAPKLSVPKKGKWQSLVHLHGLIDPVDPQGKNLVVTSGDFGAAYLTERWASRFVTELLQRFTVLFVGYSLDDPVMRYIMDALVVDQETGDHIHDAYVFASYQDGHEEEESNNWRAKSVTPIMYNQKNYHASLQKTLIAWAKVYANGLSGKKQLVTLHAHTKPRKPYSEEVSQVCWALQEPDGTVAKHFANLDPLPPIEWLEVFEETGLINLPSPAEEATQPIPLVDHGFKTCNPPALHPVTEALGDWLTGYLEHESVVQWCLSKGKSLHPGFRDKILRKLADPETKIKEPYQLFWRLLTGKTVQLPYMFPLAKHLLLDSLKKGEWDVVTREQLIQALKPCLIFQGDWRENTETTPGEEAENVELETLNNYINCSIQFALGQHGAKYFLDQLRKLPHIKKVFSDLASEVSSMLVYSLRLLELVGKASPQQDYSYLHIPSISEHPQNKSNRDWKLLVELTRDCWLSLFHSDPAQARTLVEFWMRHQYPLFIRLVLYAMTQPHLFSTEEICSYLFRDNNKWLWSVMVMREKFRLLAVLWPQLTSDNEGELIAAILKGEQRTEFSSDKEEEEWERRVDGKIWLHLAKLQSFGRELPDAAASKLAALGQKYPAWKLQDDEKDEFPTWSETYVGPRTDFTSEQLCQMSEEELLKTLEEDDSWKKEDLFYQWRWAVNNCPEFAVKVIKHLLLTQNWNATIWESTLAGFPRDRNKDNTAESESNELNSWKELNVKLLDIPKSLAKDIVRTLADWLRNQTKDLAKEEEGCFWELWDMIIDPALAYPTDDLKGDAVSCAINHPVGYLTEALIGRLWVRKPKTKSLLPGNIKERASKIVAGQEIGNLLGGVIFSSSLKDLFLIDPVWTSRYLIPAFDWADEKKALAMWQGYLWSPRMTPDLWILMKDFYIEALKRHKDLGSNKDNLLQLFTFLCLDPAGLISKKEAREILGIIDNEGRQEIAETIYRYLNDSKEQSTDLWTERISPWIDAVWPKDIQTTDSDTSSKFALAAIVTGAAFSQAVKQLENLLIPIEDFSYQVTLLKENKHPENYPKESLLLLSKIVSTDCQWPQEELREVLNQIKNAWPEAEQQQSYKDLDEYLQRKGY